MAEYAIPPWLKPADTAAQFAHGLSLGAQIQQHNNALAQEAEQHAITLQARQQELDRAHQMEKHQLELQNQFKQEELGLRKATLDQAAERTKMLTQRAAQQFAASQRVAKRIQSGEDEIKVMMEEGAMIYPGGTGAWMPGLAAEVRRRKMADIPPSLVKIGDRQFWKVANEGGGYSYKPDDRSWQLQMKALDHLHSDVTRLEAAERADLSGQLEAAKTPSPKDTPGQKALRKSYLDRHEEIKSKRQRLDEGYRNANIPQGTTAKGSAPSRGVYDPGSKTITWETESEDTGEEDTEE